MGQPCGEGAQRGFGEGAVVAILTGQPFEFEFLDGLGPGLPGRRNRAGIERGFDARAVLRDDPRAADEIGAKYRRQLPGQRRQHGARVVGEAGQLDGLAGHLALPLVARGQSALAAAGGLQRLEPLAACLVVFLAQPQRGTLAGQVARGRVQVDIEQRGFATRLAVGIEPCGHGRQRGVWHGELQFDFTRHGGRPGLGEGLRQTAAPAPRPDRARA
ncbi:hypothetical protein D3C87_1072400 [compost metagenome]